MPAHPLRIIPRSLLLPAAIVLVASSHVPLIALGSNSVVAMLIPIVATAICALTMPKYGRIVAVAALVMVTLTGVCWASEFTSKTAANLAALGVAHLIVVGTHFLLLLDPKAPANVQSRLAGRLKRQSEQLQLAIENNEDAQRIVQQRAVHDRRTLLEHLPVHVVQKDCDGRFTFVSKSFCELVKQEYSYIIGKTDFDLFPKDSASKFVRDDKQVMDSGKVFNDVEETKLHDGTRTYMQVRKAAIRDPAGEIIGVQGIFWDVTEEHASRKQLQRIQSLAHALITAALDAVLIVDGDGHVLDANPAAEKILGYTADQVASHPPVGEIMHTSVVEQGQRSTDPADGTQQYVRRAPIGDILKFATGKRIEARLRHRDESWFDAEISAQPLAIEDSQGWAIFIRNISKRKKAEQELRSAKEAAEHANATKGDFVANVSHELRTPLTGIIGLQDLLERSSLDDRQRNYIRLAKVSAGNLLTLIDDLLDFSKIEAGHIEIEDALFSLVATIEDATTALAARAQIKGLELIVAFGNDLPKQLIGDAHRIKQILLNLIGNAIKFTDRGDIRIAVSIRQQPDDSPTQDEANVRRIRVEVHDSGIGVSPEQRQVIFEAFKQADSSTTRRYGGTGLGLTICRDLVSKMHGVIGISSAQGLDGEIRQGSCFFFEVPLRIAPDTPEADNTHPSPKPTPKIESVVLAASPSAWRQVLAAEIQRLGYEVFMMKPEELSERNNPELFLAGNHTIVMIDFRELSSVNTQNAPVVIKWVVLHPLATVQPQDVPNWLKHAEISWLPRPVLREQLQESLRVESTAETVQVEKPDQINEVRSARVLLVEDSSINQTILSDMLKGLGHQVELAGDGSEAILACASKSYDLVLMDIQMPEIDGLEATKAIRVAEDSQSKGTTRRRQKICALTAHATSSDRVLCTEAGMDMFLVKPIALESLQMAIAQVMNGGVVSEELRLQPSSDDESDATKDVGVVMVAPLNLELSIADAPNWTELVEKLHGSEPLLCDVLGLVSRELPNLASDFSAAVRSDDKMQARRAVHTFKSNTRQIGLGTVAQYVEQLENMARDGLLDDLQPHAPHLERLAEHIADWADKTLAEGAS